MSKYRKKPVVIEAIQYSLDNRQKCIDFCNARHTAIGEQGEEYETQSLFIQTLEGEMRCGLGNYIIKGVEGEFYPCKLSVFEATYEDADQQPQPDTVTVDRDVLRRYMMKSTCTVACCYPEKMRSPFMIEELEEYNKLKQQLREALEGKE